MPHEDLAGMRQEYTARGFDLPDLANDPFTQFRRWFDDITAAGAPEPNAMVVSTVGASGRPSSRTVLLKGYDERGFVFYTNHGSRKASELAQNPSVCALFPWYALHRQVIVEGRTERVDDADSDAYFAVRPRGAQLGAWASEQSSVIPSREWLEKRRDEIAERYREEVPRPEFWGGYRIVPDAVEFWQGREDRLHDRLRFRRDDGRWTTQRLSP